MAKPRVYKTEAIVVKRANLGEADVIITLYTPNLGKVRAVAKGARRPKSKLGGHLDLLSRSSLLLSQGQNLDIVTQSQIIESFHALKIDLWRTSCALYVAELIDQFAPEQVENYQLYKLLQTTLQGLCESRNIELVLRYFELQLLKHLGYQPELQQCVVCRAPLVQQSNLFSASAGGTLCSKCVRGESQIRPISTDAIKVLRFLLSSAPASVSRLKIGSDLAFELEQLMRSYIRYVLEQEVRSVVFLDRLRMEANLRRPDN